MKSPLIRGVRGLIVEVINHAPETYMLAYPLLGCQEKSVDGCGGRVSLSPQDDEDIILANPA